MIYDRLIMTHMVNTKIPSLPQPPPHHPELPFGGQRIYTRRRLRALCFDLFSGLMEILDTNAAGDDG